MRSFYFCVISIFLFWTKLFSQEDPAEIHYWELTSPAARDTVKELHDRFGLIPIGQGGGAMNVIQLHSVDFYTTKIYSIEEARELVVDATEIFLKNINQCREARPFLAEYPFSPKRINLTFFVPEKIIQNPNQISLFEVKDGNVIYSVTPQNEKLWKTVFKEPYEKAKEEVLKKRNLTHWEDQTLSQKSQRSHKDSLATRFLSKLADLMSSSDYSKYYGPPEERAMEWYLDGFCRKLAKKHNLQFFRVGDFSGSKICHYYGFSFIGHQKLSIEDSRILAPEMCEAIFAQIRFAPEVQKFRSVIKDEYASFYKLTLTEEPKSKEILLKIAFWDERNDRIASPAIAQIIFIDDKFHYYRADPETGGVVEVFQESFEDAKAFRQQNL